MTSRLNTAFRRRAYALVVVETRGMAHYACGYLPSTLLHPYPWHYSASRHLHAITVSFSRFYVTSR